jgi:hypothetical protein
MGWRDQLAGSVMIPISLVRDIGFPEHPYQPPRITSAVRPEGGQAAVGPPEQSFFIVVIPPVQNHLFMIAAQGDNKGIFLKPEQPVYDFFGIRTPVDIITQGDHQIVRPGIYSLEQGIECRITPMDITDSQNTSNVIVSALYHYSAR